MYAKAIENLQDEFKPVALQCLKNKKWNQGQSLVKRFKNQKFSGITGAISFDELGLRNNSKIRMYSLSQSELILVGVKI
jgi:hypothetical protein